MAKSNLSARGKRRADVPPPPRSKVRVQRLSHRPSVYSCASLCSQDASPAESAERDATNSSMQAERALPARVFKSSASVSLPNVPTGVE